MDNINLAKREKKMYLHKYLWKNNLHLHAWLRQRALFCAHASAFIVSQQNNIIQVYSELTHQHDAPHRQPKSSLITSYQLVSNSLAKLAHCNTVSSKSNELIEVNNSENEFTAWLLSVSRHDFILTGEPGLPVGPGRPWRVKEDNAAFIAWVIFLEQKADNWQRTTYISSISAVFTRGPSGTLWAGRAWWALDWFVRLRLDVNPSANSSEMVKTQRISSGISSKRMSLKFKCKSKTFNCNIAVTVSIRLWRKNNWLNKCSLMSCIWLRVLECRRSNIGH